MIVILFIKIIINMDMNEDVIDMLIILGWKITGDSFLVPPDSTRKKWAAEWGPVSYRNQTIMVPHWAVEDLN